MSGKKGKEAEPRKVVFGRPSVRTLALLSSAATPLPHRNRAFHTSNPTQNNVKMGIVGLPNVGKSTFFNLLCNMHVPAENYPFCTVRGPCAAPLLPPLPRAWLTPQHRPSPSLAD